MNESKEFIKNRMIKKAATLWGIPANEIEMSFDPAVSLLLGACASEIEKINDQINESQTRVTEKIIQLMTPETIFGPKPAHCILKTYPDEDSVTVTPDFLFSFKKKEVEKASKKFRDVFLSPIQNFKAVKGQVKYLAYGNTVSEILPNVKEQDVLVKTERAFLEKSTLYIGIHTELNNIELKNVSIYFENQDFNKTTLFYHHLKNTKWYTEEKEIKTISGLLEKEESEGLDVILDEDSIKVSTIVEQVKNNYDRHYITLCENFNTRKEIPSSLEKVVQEHRVQIDKDVTWLKVVFPRVIDNSIFESIYCCLNTFPVINRKKEEFTYKLREFINIVPIKNSSLFLDVKSITNTNNDRYKLFNESLSSNKKGVYSIKANDISKLDERKAKEYINHLIELLKSESASFSYLNNSFLNSNLKKLNQIISLLEEKVGSSVDQEKEETNFLSVKPYQPQETLFVEYWVTDGVFANNIKYGSVLKNYKTVGLKQKSTSMLTSSYGGKDALNMNERLQAYRKTLLSRNKIVTKEDVKLTCFEFFGDRITNVVVKNGYTIDISLNKGMINCIEIQLTTNKNSEIDPFEWDFVKNNLLLFLEKNATSVFPFIIKKV